MRILVTGSRDWVDESVIYDALLEAVENVSEDVVLVSGACPTGADRIAEMFAESQGWTVERHFADWETHGRKAGPIRNSQMVRKGADIVIAFPLGESRGTRGCVKMAEKARLEIKIFEG